MFGINRAVVGSLALLGFGKANGRVASAPKTALEIALVESDAQRGFAVTEAFACLGDEPTELAKQAAAKA